MRSTSIALLAVLAVAAAAAPAAHAREAGAPDSSSAYEAPLRPDVGGFSSLQPVDRPAGGERLPGPPTWPVDPAPIGHARTTEPESGGGDLSWETIAVGLAGAAFVLVAAAGVVGLWRRAHRVAT